MGIFKNCQGSRRVIHLSIIRLIVWLGWLSNIALAQMELSQSVTGSVEFHDINLACLGNLAVFVTSLLRGRLDLEMGARDVLATMRGPKLERTNNGCGLTTCKDKKYDGASVVMLSLQIPNLSIRQFMKYISNAYNVHSIILQCFPVKYFELNLGEEHEKEHSKKCKCIGFSTVEEVIILLADQIPGKLKRLSDSLFLLLSEQCLAKGCHGCNQGLLYVEHGESGNTLKEADSQWSEVKLTNGKRSTVVIKTLEDSFREGEYNCICIPLCPSGYDYWSKLLSRSLGIRDTESAVENFSTASLIVPRLAEVFVNLALTFYFRVDGISSSLVARRSIRDYVVDSKGSGFGANAFLTKAESKVDSDTKCVCHVLTFRGSKDIRTFSFAVASVNLFCCISGVVLIAVNPRLGKWCDSDPFQLSTGRVVAITGVIFVISGMDCCHLYMHYKHWRDSSSSSPEKFFSIATVMVLVVLIIEIIGGVAIIVIMKTWGVKVFGKWLYIVAYVLVWFKWAVGSCLLGEYPPEYDSDFNYGNGILVYSSVFLLNAALAGVKSKWDYQLDMEGENITPAPAASPIKASCHVQKRGA